MIFSELQQSITAVPNADPYFAGGGKACRVFWMGEIEETTKKPLDTALAIEDALTTVGAAGLVMEPLISPVDDHFAGAAIKILFLENVSQNRGTSGTGKTAYNLAAKAWALLFGQSFAPWSALIFEGLDPVNVSDEGIEAWMLSFRCQTLLEVVETALANELSLLLASEDGSTLQVTPTDP